MGARFSIPEPYRSRIPPYSVEVLEGWVNEPRGVSGFYEALLSGDHYRAAAIADDRNLAAFGVVSCCRNRGCM